MLLSMTGYGEASLQSNSGSLSIELRAVNNRHLKVTLRAAEPYNLLEPEFEKVIRNTVRRGTIQVHFRCRRPASPSDFQLNEVALRSYLAQLKAVIAQADVPQFGEAICSQVLSLPGVVPEAAVNDYQAEGEWPPIERVLEAALEKLQAMRLEEGRAMARELLDNRDHIAAELDKIRQRVPRVTTAHRDRLLERVRSLVSELDVQVERNDLIKEVAIFAERSDIAEEIVRLASHLEQFQDIVNEPESAGRKLEFLTQEMFRETNTIGSKANDVEISRHVVEIKGTLEKIREMVQNVE